MPVILTDEERRIRHNNKNHKWRASIKERRDTTWGNKCSICGKSNNLNLHRKDGTPHKQGFSYLAKALKEPDEWVRLCYDCHKHVHWCMKWFGMDWEEIEENLTGKNLNITSPILLYKAVA